MYDENYLPDVGTDFTFTPEQQSAQRASRLTFLLDKSTIYAKIIGDRMARQQIEKAKAEKRAATRKENKDKKGEPSNTGTREGMREKKKGGEDKEEAVVAGKRKRKSEPVKEDKRPKLDEEVRRQILNTLTSTGCKGRAYSEPSSARDERCYR